MHRRRIRDLVVTAQTLARNHSRDLPEAHIERLPEAKDEEIKQALLNGWLVY